MLRFLVLATMLAVFGLTGCGSEKTKATGVSTHNWVEDNDLWKEDNVNFAGSNVSEEMFNAVIDIAEKLYAPIAKDWNET